MKQLPRPESITSAAEYTAFLNDLYMKVPRQPEQLVIPPIQAIAVSGNQPPSSKQYEQAIGVLYGLAYTLKMGLKFQKLERPDGYFDYKVGALETLWWSTKSGTFDITDAKTLRWMAYLMVPSFVPKPLFEAARVQASAKHPDIKYELGKLETIDEGASAQVLHVGPYSAEEPTIARLRTYIADQGLHVRGKHHEIYLSDPRRTKPERLKTVIRYPVA